MIVFAVFANDLNDFYGRPSLWNLYENENDAIDAVEQEKASDKKFNLDFTYEIEEWTVIPDSDSDG